MTITWDMCPFFIFYFNKGNLRRHFLYPHSPYTLLHKILTNCILYRRITDSPHFHGRNVPGQWIQVCRWWWTRTCWQFEVLFWWHCIDLLPLFSKRQGSPALIKKKILDKFEQGSVFSFIGYEDMFKEVNVFVASVVLWVVCWCLCYGFHCFGYF